MPTPTPPNPNPATGFQRVEVRPVHAHGRNLVLLQLPDGHLLVTPGGARRIAGMLLDAATEAAVQLTPP